ncbi:MAG: winged helix-turn-helix domain-containing protein [Methanobacteriota archaeon]
MEIIQAVLRAVHGSGKKTHVMYRANLSYDMTLRYIEHLLTCGLIVRDESSQRYCLTDKGYECLTHLDKVLGYLREPPAGRAPRL